MVSCRFRLMLLSTIKAVMGILTCTGMASNSMSESECFYWQVRVLLLS